MKGRWLRTWLWLPRTAESPGTVDAPRVFCVRARETKRAAPATISSFGETPTCEAPDIPQRGSPPGSAWPVLSRPHWRSRSMPSRPRGRRAGPPPIRSTRPQALLAKTKQDKNLKPHATPLTVTPPEKIPLDKIKVPAGFKVELWAHGMPGVRMMTRGDKGTIFVGTRAIGKVYAITDKGGAAHAQGHRRGPEAAQRPRLPRTARSTSSPSTRRCASTASRTSSTARR